MSNNMCLKVIKYITLGIIWTLALIIFVICAWSVNTFNISLSEILFTITNSLNGADTSIVEQGLKECIPPVVIGILLYIALVVSDIILKVNVILNINLRKFKFSLNIKTIFQRSISILVLFSFVFSIIYANSQYQIVDYIASRFDATNIYENYYIHPNSVNISADGDEKNLIYIYMESMETTYASTDVGGYQDVNYIPNLTRLANENISFSNSEKLGGFLRVDQASWTASALLAATSGIPYSFPFTEIANLHKTSGLTALGDILDEFNYNQYFLCGSDAEYGGRKTYFEQHGNYHIIDLFEARERKYIPRDYYVSWGYEDKYLYDIAKQEVTNAYNTGKPFNFTMLTVDTHFPEGYICSLCKSDYSTVAENVISCADRQINDFIEWCKQQPFYENTVIIITGDHPRMDTCLIENISLNERTTYNCFINCGEYTNLNTQNRIFTTMDMFPTTLSAIGFEFDGSRIGLGTDMFSGELTLAEKLGFEYFESEISKYSQYYIDNFS